LDLSLAAGPLVFSLASRRGIYHPAEFDDFLKLSRPGRLRVESESHALLAAIMIPVDIADVVQALTTAQQLYKVGFRKVSNPSATGPGSQT
jgi:hypothetical protein